MSAVKAVTALVVVYFVFYAFTTIIMSVIFRLCGLTLGT